MKDSYIPRKLEEIIPAVVQRHPSTAAVTGYHPDQSFLDQVREWVQVPETQINDTAYTIPPRMVVQLADYLGTNSLGVPTEKLIRMVCIRTNERITKRILSRWPDYYLHSDYMDLMEAILTERSEVAEKVLEQSKVTSEVLLDWIKSENIPHAVGKYAIKNDESNSQSFRKTLQEINVSPESKLGKQCIEEYYTFCGEKSYLQIKDEELLRVLKRYSYKQIKSFLDNYLTVMETENLRRYFACGRYLRNSYTGVPDSTRFKAFFSGFSEQHINQYSKWLSYVLIAESFSNNSNDPRLRFWSKYVPYSSKTYLERQSSALIMVYEKCCVIEFTSETMGPIYIYQKEDFNKRIKLATQIMKNLELRSYLYNGAYYARFVHDARGSWQHKVARYLTQHDDIA